MSKPEIARFITFDSILSSSPSTQATSSHTCDTTNTPSPSTPKIDPFLAASAGMGAHTYPETVSKNSKPRELRAKVASSPVVFHTAGTAKGNTQSQSSETDTFLTPTTHSQPNPTLKPTTKERSVTMPGSYTQGLCSQPLSDLVGNLESAPLLDKKSWSKPIHPPNSDQMEEAAATASKLSQRAQSCWESVHGQIVNDCVAKTPKPRRTTTSNSGLFPRISVSQKSLSRVPAYHANDPSTFEQELKRQVKEMETLHNAISVSNSEVLRAEAKLLETQAKFVYQQ
eukprot:c13433_g1_i1.p1 GENE.c13433_g1_i1~~c13433_g1_i1.p1  ORF type:complete len:284 (+),score=74.29 c13433_g1_i1:221-1072(+)